MKLSKVANYFDKESFSVYDRLNNKWELNELKGRLLPVDRFLSNFSRPLHRRMLVCEVSTIIPPSATIRSEATGDTYIIGQGRFDAYSNNSYQAMYMAHMVSGSAGGIGIVTRRSPKGTVADPGHLVKEEVGRFYMDVELRATTPETGTTQEQAGQYFLMAPPECNLLEWDYVELNGRNYKVEEDYFDSGLKFSRVTQTEDNRVDLIYNRTTGFDYSEATGLATDTIQPFNVTGTVHEYLRTAVDPGNIGENTFRIVISSDHIGFDPRPRESVVVEATTHAILEVTRDPLTTEWVLICQA